MPIEINFMKNNIFKKKVILITGATGSFGNCIVDELLKNYNFKKLIIFSRDELKQFHMSNKFKNNKLRFLLGDIRDKDRFDFACKNVDIIIHAAALKQVPAAEYNPDEFIKTNIIGATNIIKAAIKNKVQKIISLSTDKASSPINLYGATKLVSDKLFIAGNNIVGSQNTLFSVVRYGNVINSRGSVIPFFLSQLTKKEFTITHEEMTRFFMTIQQSVDFVIQSLKIMRGGEIFIPKLDAFKIINIAKKINSLKKIKIIGLRPGEKIHETLFSKDESLRVNEFKSFFVLLPSISFNKKRNYLKYNNEKGKKIKKQFEYNSLDTSKTTNDAKLKKIILSCKI